MTNWGDPSINCTACDRQYRWKEQYAGKKMKCKCGEVIVMPEEPDGLDDIDDLYGVENAANPQADHCPSCGKRLKPGAVLCIGCGYNLQTGGVVETAVGGPPVNAPAQNQSASHRQVIEREARRQAEQEEIFRRHRRKEFLYPILMLLTGLFFIPVLVNMQVSGAINIITTSAMIAVGIIVVMVPALLVSIFISSWLLDISFGSLWTALLKLTAISVGPGLLADLIFMLVAPFFMGPFALFFVGYIIYLVIMGIPFAWLFDLDMRETQGTILIIGTVRIFVAILLYAVFLA